MPCHSIDPIQDLFLDGFSYVLQIDMHFICTPMWTKFYSCKKWVLQKRDIVEYVSLCDTCQSVKAEHQRPVGLLQPLKQNPS
jgi:hypothetical protein